MAYAVRLNYVTQNTISVEENKMSDNSLIVDAPLTSPPNRALLLQVLGHIAAFPETWHQGDWLSDTTLLGDDREDYLLGTLSTGWCGTTGCSKVVRNILEEGTPEPMTVTVTTMPLDAEARENFLDDLKRHALIETVQA